MTEVRQERKVVTVLFADLVGFTARAEQLDPEDVAAVLRPYHERLRSELERFGGTVEKFIGDAVMALFGAPVAHEDDPERAVRAALAIRDWAREENDVEVRIAVNTGEALINLDARPQSGEGMAAGDVVNTTARLQSSAPVNGVLVGETTYRATTHVVDYRQTEDVQAKGKAQPLHVWEAVALRADDASRRELATATPLVGRDAELDDLSAALVRARRGSPQLVSLVGVPGIGKSRLVRELGDRVRADVTWLVGRCLAYGEGVALWALAEIVKAHADILENDDADVAAEKLQRAVSSVVPEPEDARWIEQQLRPLVGLSVEQEEGGDQRTKAFAAWRSYLEAVAEQRPLVLVFEDLHWAEEALLDFLDHLVGWANDVPMLVLCTSRPELLERRPDWGGGKPNATTLSLSPLDDDEIAEVFAAVLGRFVLPAERREELLLRAGGNPLFAEQFARMLAERHGDDAALPETIQGIIAGRLDGLPSPEKSLLQDAAVIGDVFWVGAVSFLQGDVEDSIDDLLHSLVRKEFLQRARRSSVAGDEEYAFRHLLLRDVAYAQIPRSERAVKHRAAAEWINALGRADEHAEMLAHHYARAFEFASAAGQDVSDLAAETRRALRDAGNRAADLNAFAAAARFYESALELYSADDRERGLVLLRAGKALRLSGEPRAVGLLEEAVEKLIAGEDLEHAAEAELQLADIWRSRGHRENVRQHVRRAQQLLHGRSATPAHALVLSEVARYHMLDEESDSAIKIGREALAVAELLGLAEVVAATLCTIGTARNNAGDAGGREDVERSLQLALEVRSPEACRAYNNLAAILFSEGDLRRAQATAAEGIRAAEQLGNTPILVAIRSWDCDWAYAEGRWDECTRIADDFIAACETGSPHQLEGWTRITRGSIRLARADVTGALEDAERGVSAGRLADTAQILPDPLAFLARVYAELGRPAEAEAVARELISYFQRGVGGRNFAPIRLAWIAEGLGLTADARAALAQLPTAGRWLEAAKLVLDERYIEAADLFVEAGSLPEEAFARLSAARLLAAGGWNASADEQLARALSFYRSVGARRYVREAETLFAASA